MIETTTKTTFASHTKKNKQEFDKNPGFDTFLGEMTDPSIPVFVDFHDEIPIFDASTHHIHHRKNHFSCPRENMKLVGIWNIHMFISYVHIFLGFEMENPIQLDDLGLPLC